MRKILYPLFLLTLVVIAGVFLWDDLSSFWKKALLVAGAAFAFFTFKGLLFFLFGFLLNSLSLLLKYLLAIVLFLLVAFGIWHFLPHSITNKVEETFSSSGTTIAESITNGIDGAKDSVNSATSKLSDSAKNTVDGAKNSIQESSQELVENTRNIPSNLAEKIAENTKKPENFENNKKGNTSQNTQHQGWKKPVVRYTNDLHTKKTQEEIDAEAKMKAENKSEDEREYNIDTRTDSITSILQMESEKNEGQDTTQSKENSEENLEKKSGDTNTLASSGLDIEKMKQNGFQLPSSGSRESGNRIDIPSINAQAVYPAEYTVANVLYTDDTQVSFSLTAPDNSLVFSTIEIVKNGNFYTKYAPLFEGENTSAENVFYAENSTSTSIEYVTFFEGKLWKISFQSQSETSAENFYSFLKPVLFEKA